MAKHRCSGDGCTSCEGRISELEDSRNGVSHDPSGRMADYEADRYEDWLRG